jgi:nitroreductase
MTGFDLDQIDHLLTSTRAVRRRLDLSRPVPRDVLLECIGIATQAPTGGNRQPWRWLVIDDRETKAAIAEWYREASGPYMAQQTQAMEEEASATPRSRRMFESGNFLSEHLDKVPALVIPCSLDRPRIPERLDDPMAAFHLANMYGSVLPAVWSFMLAGRARGLGTAYTTFHLQHEGRVADLLGVPSSVSQLALIPVGYFTGDDFKPAERRPVDDVVYWNRWRGRSGRA